jgi:hypothetical protein
MAQASTTNVRCLRDPGAGRATIPSRYAWEHSGEADVERRDGPCATSCAGSRPSSLGAATPGERQAAGAAAERIRLQLAAAASTEPAVEMHFSIPNPWSRRLLIAALPPVTRWSGEPSPAMSAY